MILRNMETDVPEELNVAASGKWDQRSGEVRLPNF